MLDRSLTAIGQYYRFSELCQESDQQKILSWPNRFWLDPPESVRPFRRTLLFGRSPAGRSRGLAGLRRLAAQPFDLTAGQSDEDLADPFELHAVDRLGVKALEIDQARRTAALDCLQIALAALEPDRSLLSVEARQRIALLAINDNNVAILIFGQHGIARDLEGNGL